jgi:transcriptional regulator with XRE-family HTH domain
MENTLRLRRAEQGTKGVSQMAVAKAIGMSFNRYWRIENDETEPEAKEIKSLARYFKCSASVLFPSLLGDGTKRDGAAA